MTAKIIPCASLRALRPLFCLGLAFAFGITARAEDTPPPLLVLPLPKDGSDDAKEAQTGLELRAIGEAKEAWAAIYLKSGKTPSEVSRIFAYLLDAKKRSVVPGAMVTLKDGDVDLLAKPLTLPPLPQPQPGILKVTNIPSAGTFYLRLVAQLVNGELKTITDIPVQCSPREIKWAGLPADGSFSFKTERTAFVHVFELDGDADADGPKIEHGVLSDENGTTVPAEWTISEKSPAKEPGKASAPAATSDGQNVQLRLKADLPVFGNYQTKLVLVRGSDRRTTAVKITRTKPAAPTVAVYGLSATRITVTRFADYVPNWVNGLANHLPVFMRPSTTEYVPVWMTLQDASNQGASITALTTSTLTLKNPQKGPAAATFEKTELVRKENGRPIEPPLVLESSKATPLEMRFWKLYEPGEYTGTLLLTTGDGETLNKEFTLYLKESAWRAGLWIALGVLVSTGIRWYRNRVRPQLVQLENHHQLESDAATLHASLPPLEPAEEQVWNNWRRRLDELGRALDGDPVADADARLALLNHQLSLFPKWVKARRHVLELQTPAAALTQIVQTAENYLNKTAEQTGEFDTQQAALDGIDTQIAQARFGELDQRLAALIAAARAQRPNLTNGGRTALDQWLSRATAPLVGELAVREQRLRQLRGDYAALLAEDLEATISIAATPAGFSANEWQALQQDISSLTAQARQSAVTDPESALVSYYGAVDRYLRAASLKLQVAATQLRSRLSAADASKADAVIARAKTVVDNLDLAEPDRARAGAEYRGAAADYAALPLPLPAAPAIGAVVAAVAAVGIAATAIDAATLPQNPAFGEGPAIRSRSPRRLRSIEPRTRMRKLLDVALWVLLLATAVAVGLKLLWVDDQVWGGWTACLTALLWGLGLHQIGGQAFEGTTGLLTRITK